MPTSPRDNAGSGIFGLIMSMLGPDGRLPGAPRRRGGAHRRAHPAAGVARRHDRHRRGGDLGRRPRRPGGRRTDRARRRGLRRPRRRRRRVGPRAVRRPGPARRPAGTHPLGHPAFPWDPVDDQGRLGAVVTRALGAGPPDAPGTVHIAHSVEELGTFAAQIKGHTVPAAPLLLTGQMTATDPTRSPAGTESLWAYTHVPQQTRSDAGEAGIRGVWDGSDLERMADRMQARIERFAPDFASRILGRRAMGPREFEARRRQPPRRRDQRRYRRTAARARAAAGSRHGPRRDSDQGAVPRVRLRASGRWRPRRARSQRRQSGAPPLRHPAVLVGTSCCHAARGDRPDRSTRTIRG